MTDSVLAPYKPLPWQIGFFRDKSFICLATGSAGGGKSRAAAEKMHAYCMKYPGATGLILRKAREYAKRSVIPFMQQTIISNDPAVHYRVSDMIFDYDNGSVIYVGGMKNEEQRQAVRSIGGEGGLDIVWMEEANAFLEEDLNELVARMRGRAAPWMQIMLTTNPDASTHWIKRRLMDGGEAAIHLSRATDNPFNPGEYVSNLQSITGILKDRLVLGLWKKAEGSIYREWDTTVHLIPAFEIPTEWRRFRSIDFGYNNPFVCQWWAIDPDNRLYLYREIYMSERIVEDHAALIKQLSAGEYIEATIADHDAEDRATLARHGVPSNPAVKDVSPGIQAVQQRLRVQEDGRPTLFILRGSLVEEDPVLVSRKRPICTHEEIDGYVWQKTPEGKPDKEQPVKLDDHGVDAMRYAVMYLDSGQQFKVLFEI